MEAWNWAQENNVRIYPVPLKKTYTVNKMVYGKRVKQQVPWVVLEANLDGNIVRFDKDEYKQDDDYLTEIIEKLYKYYYDRAQEKLR